MYVPSHMMQVGPPILSRMQEAFESGSFSHPSLFTLWTATEEFTPTQPSTLCEVWEVHVYRRLAPSCGEFASLSIYRSLCHAGSFCAKVSMGKFMLKINVLCASFGAGEL